MLMERSLVPNLVQFGMEGAPEPQKEIARFVQLRLCRTGTITVLRHLPRFETIESKLCMVQQITEYSYCYRDFAVVSLRPKGAVCQVRSAHFPTHIRRSHCLSGSTNLLNIQSTFSTR